MPMSLAPVLLLFGGQEYFPDAWSTYIGHKKDIWDATQVATKDTVLNRDTFHALFAPSDKVGTPQGDIECRCFNNAEISLLGKVVAVALKSLQSAPGDVQLDRLDNI